MTQEFKQAVAEKNLAYVRMMLSNELLTDPRGGTFAEMLAYAKNNLPDLFEAEEPSRFTIPSDRSEWNDDILSKMKRDLNMNFSVEKLALYEEMAKYLGADKAERLNREDLERERRQRAAAEERRQAEQHRTASGSSNARRNASYICTGGGAAIGITGLCINGTLGTVLSVVGGVAVIAGVTLYVVSKNSK